MFADEYPHPAFCTLNLLLPELTIVTISRIYSSCSQGHSHLVGSACAVYADGSPALRYRRHLQRPARNTQRFAPSRAGQRGEAMVLPTSEEPQHCLQAARTNSSLGLGWRSCHLDLSPSAVTELRPSITACIQDEAAVSLKLGFLAASFPAS